MWDQTDSNSEALILQSNMGYWHDSERETSGRWGLGTSAHSMHFLYLDTSARTQHAPLLFKASGQNLNTYQRAYTLNYLEPIECYHSMQLVY